MAKKRKTKKQAYALDPRITRCAEQAFNIHKDEKTGGYFLEYYIVNDLANIEKSDVFNALENNKSLLSVVNGIHTYQKNYHLKKNRGLKSKDSKALKIMGHFDKEANLLASGVALSSRVSVFRLKNENVTQSFFAGKTLLPTHKNSDVLKLANEFSEKIGLKTGNSENLAKNISYAASIITANIAKKNNTPFLYPDISQCQDAGKISNKVTLDSRTCGEKPLQAFADAPLREFRKAVNFVQLARLANRQEPLEKHKVQLAADASNHRREKLLAKKVHSRKNNKKIEIKKVGLNEEFIKNLDTVSLIFIQARAELNDQELEPIYEKELSRRLIDNDIEKDMIDTTFIALNFIDKHKTLGPIVKAAKDVLEKQSTFIKKGKSYIIN